MSEENILKPDYLFEISWEVCNKVGGIYTVISTKASTLVSELKDNYIFIGPDVWKETQDNPEFTEDKFLYRSWREEAEKQGLRFRLGRWNIAGNPVAILVDFTPYFVVKDKIFAKLWENYKLDSLPGQWDYIEPAMFGFAAAKIIESFYEFNISGRDRIIAQFHEWMTGTGILYLKDNIPQVGTVFTTHATALGRCVAGNGLPLYKDIESFNADVLARNFNIVSKQSLEKLSAQNADGFTTVSEITNKECKQFLEKEADVITPNGFDSSFLPPENVFEEKRDEARVKLFDVAEALLNQELQRDSMLVLISGRYEFRNKGIDLYIDALTRLYNNPDLDKDIIAFIMVPANNAGPRKDVYERIGKPNYEQSLHHEFLTHYLHDPDNDPVLKKIYSSGISNEKGSKVKIIFVPSYLNGSDGIFNMHYYELLIGFDVTVFPSYYEPWGYTPMESIAFHIPTITTTLAGFGNWIRNTYGKLEKGILVIDRDDDNDESVVEQIAAGLTRCLHRNFEDKKSSRKKAHEISHDGLWVNFINNYYKIYDKALREVAQRETLFSKKQLPEQTTILRPVQGVKPTWKKILVKSDYPEGLSELVKLTKNLWWSWNNDAKELFEMVNPELWEKSQHNPIAMLESLSYEQLLELERDKEFRDNLKSVYEKFGNYLLEGCNKKSPAIAYFSMEYGLHDSLKIFSGGLGVLAGDYLKQCSDSNINITGIGLLYRYGYFSQELALNGEQLENYYPQKFSHLPLNPVRVNNGDEHDSNNGSWLKIRLALPGRTLYAKVWRVDVGRVPLYLLDTDIEENSDEDRFITHRLYGGEWENRLKQEILLGAGGIRLLDAVNITPDIYHCNEGHAAFMGVERMRKLVQEEFFTFQEAIEIVRASSLFTTHTPVPAGHDEFSEDLLRTYIPHYAERLNISWDAFMNLGRAKENVPGEKFSMSVLALKLSQEVNGVSKIHGRVTREMFSHIWDGYFSDELHIGYVTNGVHYPTWAAKKWKQLYDAEFGEGFNNDQSNAEYWRNIFRVSDEQVWNIKQSQRKDLIDFVKKRLMGSLERRLENPKTIIELQNALNENALTIGFARRFATYKRAQLIFKNLEKLARIVNNPNKPVQFIFAGKAHPADGAGQELIRYITEVSKRKEFLGKIIFLENYDMDIASKLVQGVDIWLNTPARPMEASGTSGQKAVMNGVMNFSVLDGWWAEGYIDKAGWALKEETTYKNPQYQDELDAETIYDLLEDTIVPMFYKRDKNGVPSKWVSHIKNTIAEIAPRFTTKRMLDDYCNQYYNKLYARTCKFKENNYELVRNLSNWKKKMIRGWNSIEVLSVSVPDSSKRAFKLGEKFVAEISLNLNELSSDDIGIEVIFGNKDMDQVHNYFYKNEMRIVSSERNLVTYKTEIFVTRSGVFDYAFRMFPKNPLLPHRMDFYLI